MNYLGKSVHHNASIYRGFMSKRYFSSTGSFSFLQWKGVTQQTIDRIQKDNHTLYLAVRVRNAERETLTLKSRGIEGGASYDSEFTMGGEDVQVGSSDDKVLLIKCPNRDLANIKSFLDLAYALVDGARLETTYNIRDNQVSQITGSQKYKFYLRGGETSLNSTDVSSSGKVADNLIGNDLTLMKASA